MTRTTFVISTITVFLWLTGHALQIDEKLTIRLLKISDSKRTILLNRGLEDGVMVGDHAKFFLTTGVIARAVAVKASPSRSIWSVYRKVVPHKLVVGEVMNLVITNPAKVTDDATKMLNDNTMLPKDVIIAEGANDLPEELNQQEQGQLAEVGGGQPSSNNAVNSEITLARSNFYSNQIWSLYGMLYFSHLSSEVTNNSVSSIGALQQIDLSAGVERYFSSQTSWYKNSSIFIEFSRLSGQQLSLTGSMVEQAATEFGIGGSWHFYNHIFAKERPIGFIKFGVGLGSYSDTYSTSSLSSSTTYQGSGNYFSLGVGGKYYSRYNVGIKFELELFSRSEAFNMNDGSQSIRGSYGPRIRLGVVYRF
ncbi:MAG: hypothetical protein HN353_06270 [Bdellovibrionales bacterium]|jgi:hypothetical protein|nr:hypothetical protein [Bdellovibrionales bacterium]MBT3526238.1 hypothetical protein [Bdellovibrionales bacterium]MBT7670564.1 hypothetical protein [Bdellovibrionales bacterium]MBT7766431.1 hypothetical protein [Bdellovibrionales bacterium]